MIGSFLGVCEYIFIPWLSMSLLVFILICCTTILGEREKHLMIVLPLETTQI